MRSTWMVTERLWSVVVSWFGRPAWHVEVEGYQFYQMCVTVNFHNFNSHNFNLRVSNPRTVAYSHSNVPFESSNLPGSGRTYKTWAFENRLYFRMTLNRWFANRRQMKRVGLPMSGLPTMGKWRGSVCPCRANSGLDLCNMRGHLPMIGKPPLYHKSNLPIVGKLLSWYRRPGVGWFANHGQMRSVCQPWANEEGRFAHDWQTAGLLYVIWEVICPWLANHPYIIRAVCPS